MERLIVAEDGSAGARVITDVLCRWRLLGGSSARVVSVSGADATARHHDWADGCAERLAACGIRADAEVRVGDPAHQIVEAAVEHDADLIITGSRGHSGLRRLLVGSVARNVVLHAPCSVLVMRQAPQREMRKKAAAIAGWSW
jgi:nucleotide-binding universal stress UspA family protein